MSSTAMKVLTALIGLLALPFHIYGSWLLYNHVTATDLMWFIWWVTIPLTIIFQIFASIVKATEKEVAA